MSTFLDKPKECERTAINPPLNQMGFLPKKKLTKEILAIKISIRQNADSLLLP